MAETYKFNSSNKFCFECDWWKDRNANGFGICTNPKSLFNNREVIAMNKCKESVHTPKEVNWEVAIERDGTVESTSPQSTYEDAYRLAKNLTMNEIEALTENGESVTVKRLQDEWANRTSGFTCCKTDEKLSAETKISIHKMTLVDRIKEQVCETKEK